MARVYDLAFDASRVRECYQQVHDRVFSLRRTLLDLALGTAEDYAELSQKLSELRSRLTELKADVGALTSRDLTRRASTEVQDALLSYVDALGETVARLECICSRLDMEQQALPGYTDYSASDMRQDKVDYDDALQEYRRQGMRLQQLFDKV
jgi:phage shock protein A